MTSNRDESLRHGPEGLSMSPSERRGRVRHTMSPAEEKRLTVELERTEQMLTADIRIAGALMEMIEAGVLPRSTQAISPKHIQALFADAGDRALPGGGVGRVLRRVNVHGNSVGRVMPWAVLDADEKLEELVNQDRKKLAQTKIELGKA